MEIYDVIVIGGGTSGTMAAIAAAENGAKTLVLEKNPTLGKKLLVTGGGRCNVTNNRDADSIIAHIPGNGRFLYSAFNQFDNHDIMNFFESNGVRLKEEDHGRMFPVTDKSRTILEALLAKMKALGVEIRTNVTVAAVQYENQAVKSVRLADDTEILCKKVIVSTGGRAMPRTGSTGDGYKWAKKAGHTLAPLYPTEAPILSSEPFIENKELQGLSLRDVALKVLNKKQKVVITHQMDMIFTHFGVSGPAALRCSMFVHTTMKKDQTDTVTMSLDALPDVSPGALTQQLQQLQKNEGDKSLKNALKNLCPERYLLFLCKKSDINEQLPLKQIEETKLQTLQQLLKDFQFQVNGTLPLEKAFVTGGGISTKEVQPKTMESKLMSGLYFTGEILDVNGYTGGYNITAAFITGHIAGLHAAQSLESN